MSTVTVTADTRDVLSRPDNAAFVFASPGTRGTADGRVVTARPRTVQPLNGVLTVELLPGPVRVEYKGETYDIVVPESDANLWELLGVLP